ncbi:MAG: hypothetical protein IJX26_00675 [Clostridia bacterium]|nr:hypothetical protein [Clostridia bacterium]
MSNYKKLKHEILLKNECHALNQIDNTIHIKMNSIDEILSPFSEDNRAVINSEFAEFLDNSVKDVPIKNDITLEIESKDKDEEKISTAIKNYYYNEFMESERQLKRNLLFSITTLIMGVISILLTSLSQHLNLNYILTNTLDILAWVFVWEAFDLFFFRRIELKHQQYRQMNFINANIIFK